MRERCRTALPLPADTFRLVVEHTEQRLEREAGQLVVAGQLDLRSFAVIKLLLQALAARELGLGASTATLGLLSTSFANAVAAIEVVGRGNRERGARRVIAGGNGDENIAEAREAFASPRACSS